MQRGQHDPLHYAERCGVSADAEAEREHGDDGKGGRLTQHAQSVAQVLPKHFHRTLSKYELGRSHLNSAVELGSLDLTLQAFTGPNFRC